jgi:vacuolar-type H+-ATPase subunit D/Vma8
VTFSQGKDTLKEKRASLADETFEMLMFMRGNKHA